MSYSLDLTSFRQRVQDEIDAEFARQRDGLAVLGRDVEPLVDAIASLLRAGKRLRAAFCSFGYSAAGGTNTDAALRAAAAMELFQAAALLHDDVMDDSRMRRGLPTAHEVLASTHRNLDWSGDARRFGVAGAILAGNLCLVWSDEMMATSGWSTEEMDRARPVFDTMRSQLMGGQFLDVLDSVRGWEHLDAAQRIDSARAVIRYKSAQYSVEQPLLIGARAAGLPPEQATHLSRYGLALGEAFQMRDDLLGVFGDPAATGKPAGDDLREGKRTVLMALTLRDCPPEQSQTLTRHLGSAHLTDAHVDHLRSIITDSGAPQNLEEMIEQDTRLARAELQATQGLTNDGQAALDALIDLATARDT